MRIFQNFTTNIVDGLTRNAFKLTESKNHKLNHYGEKMY